MNRLFALALSLALPLVASASPVHAEGTDEANDSLRVHVHGLRSDHGSVRCSLYDQAEGFPEGQSHVIARARALPSHGGATCVFPRAPARGHAYAVAIHHDENDDGAFQRGAFGVPLEGFGFSRDARPVLSAPSFEACQLRFDGGAPTLQIVAQYF